MRKLTRDASADLEARTEAGFTPQHAAAGGSSDPAVVTALVSAGADLEARTESGFTQLHVAAGGSAAPAALAALVNASANLEAKSEGGLTPLHVVAADSGTPAVATALVNAGADPNPRDHALQRPLDYAQSNVVLKNTEAYAQFSDATTRIRIDDMVETWTKLGSLILWGIAAIAGLGIWGLFSLPVSPRMVYAGSIAIYLLAGILGYLAPDWAVALSGNQPWTPVSRT